MYNPSLRQEKRSDKAPVIPLHRDASILGWLESTGRLLERETKETDLPKEDEEEISALMGNEEEYDDSDDDDDLDEEED
jgi:hypothetical protein